ncbi:MAG: Nif3-like dinuclear metal center hexameric protein [Bacteroidales bacterium]|jgi:dinuclear metal center YbgI/SA1388 family protein|nr:Nif3-like dinuclear metal center hexameric protein [Bacteroidales bacterium]
MILTVKDICDCIEAFAPHEFQESWDNSGLTVGLPQQPVNRALLTIDVTEAVVEEAVSCGAQIIISHHPVTLTGIRKLTGATGAQRTIFAAIRNGIALYAAHTNMDMAYGGVSHQMARKLDLRDIKTLLPQEQHLRKLVTYVPLSCYEKVRAAVFKAGAGHTGKYDCCGFGVEGNGTFRALTDARPFVGQRGELHTEREIRFETIFPAYLQREVTEALLAAHPYEEVAYDVYTLQNRQQRIGLGVSGILPAPLDELRFLQLLKDAFAVPTLRHTPLLGKKVHKVALCGGSGSALAEHAIRCGAQAFVTADVKYHQFADVAESILVADLGHFESEQYTREIFHALITKKFPTFAVQFSNVNTNPINYL